MDSYGASSCCWYFIFLDHNFIYKNTNKLSQQQNNAIWLVCNPGTYMFTGVFWSYDRFHIVKLRYCAHACICHLLLFRDAKLFYLVIQSKCKIRKVACGQKRVDIIMISTLFFLFKLNQQIIYFYCFLVTYMNSFNLTIKRRLYGCFHFHGFCYEKVITFLNFLPFFTNDFY